MGQIKKKVKLLKMLLVRIMMAVKIVIRCPGKGLLSLNSEEITKILLYPSKILYQITTTADIRLHQTHKS